MSTRPQTEEVQVLRFFETGPIEKVEAVFNIVTAKMQDRLRDRHPSETGRSAEPVGKKRPAPMTPTLPPKPLPEAKERGEPSP